MASAQSSVQPITDWDFHAPRFDAVLAAFAPERRAAPVASFDLSPRPGRTERRFLIKTQPTLLGLPMTAELAFRDDADVLTITDARVSDRHFAEYLFANALALVLDRRPHPTRVVVRLPWADHQRRRAFAAARGEWSRGWAATDLGRALARFGFRVLAVDAANDPVFASDGCATALASAAVDDAGSGSVAAALSVGP